MKIYQSIILLCNLFFILPIVCEENSEKVILVQNVSVKNVYASELKSVEASDILNEKLEETNSSNSISSNSEKATSKPRIVPRKQAELPHESNSLPNKIETNMNNTTPRPNNPVQQLNEKIKNDIKSDNKTTTLNPVITSILTNPKSEIEKNKNGTSTISPTIIKNKGREGVISEVISTPVESSKVNDKKNLNITSTKLTTLTTIKPNASNSEKSNGTTSTQITPKLKSTTSTSTTTTTTAKVRISTTRPTKPSTTTTTTTKKPTTTTKKPPKPKITYSEADLPQISYFAKMKQNDHLNRNSKNPSMSAEEPVVQPVKEMVPPGGVLHAGHRDYILPIVALIFAVPIIMGGVIISYRRLKDYWSTRHYRRMDFLVDGMYND